MKPRKKAGVARVVGATTMIALTATMILSGCTANSGSGGGKTTITLSGPNQFNSDTKSFGPAWDKLVSAFEKANPDIILKTNVLPISSWNQASTTQLSAGTATELIFNQTTHKPNQVLSLDSYLNKPDPFISGNKKWIDAFNPKYFAGPKKLGINGNGHHEWVPFNLVGTAIYFNADILKKENINVSSLKTFDGFINSCKILKKAGIAPVATDNSSLTTGWELDAIGSTMFDSVVKKINVFDAAGNPGTSSSLNPKSTAKAVLTGELSATNTPQISASLELLKKFNDACATPNWSGVSASGAFTGGPDFQAGKAAMAWGTNFAASNLADSGFKYGTVTFPTISKSDSQYASGAPAQFGVSAGGTSYMIPAYITGKKRAAAIKFLQFVSSPTYMQDWLDATKSIPSQLGAKSPAGLDAFLSGVWGTVPVQGLAGAFLATPKAETGKNILLPYLTGDVSLSSALTTFQQNNVTAAKEAVSDNGWTGSWTNQ